MSLEQRDASQICSFDPPLPRRAFQISSLSTSSEGEVFPGASTQGSRYGKMTLNTWVWSSHPGQATSPMVVGEKFGIYRATETRNFDPTVTPSYSTSKVDPGKLVYSTGSTADGASPDLLRFWDYQIKTGRWARVDTGNSPFTVTAVVNTNGADGWTVYFSGPFTDPLTIDGSYGIVTLPEPMNGIWYGQLGNIQGINYAYSCPGGPSTLTFLLAKPPDFRSQAMNPGRILQVFRGASCIWEGTQQEPSPSAAGWTISAQGSGTYGGNYTAVYDVPYWNPDQVLNQAIGRGLRWAVPEPIGKPSGIYLGQMQDSGSMTVTDFLNLMCTGGGLYWSVEPPAGSKVPAGPWNIRLRPFPQDLQGDPLAQTAATATSWNVQEWQRTDLKAKLKRLPPDLYIVNTSPIPRTISNDYNTLVIKYMSKADQTATSTVKASAAVYKTVVVDSPGAVSARGRTEYYLDVSASGVMSSAAVVNLGQQILKHYARAAWSQDFTVQPGDLINNGGVPVDLGCNWCGKVASVQVDNAAFGGEVGMGTVNFLIAGYTYDDDSQTATITPYQSQRTDISSVISQLYPGKFA